MKIWVDGVEGEDLAGLTASFGALLPEEANKSPKLPAVFSNPLNGCSNSSSKVLSQFIMFQKNFGELASPRIVWIFFIMSWRSTFLLD